MMMHCSIKKSTVQVGAPKQYKSVQNAGKRHMSTRGHHSHFPPNVGILAMDVYFPKTYVSQEELEQFDGVSKGKYTVGLEQENMAFCGDREDIYSMSLTVTNSIMQKYNLSPKDIGRLEVGTETIIDKSKSVKTVLMSLFEKSGNYNIEGVDTINACYGMTNALLNAVNWIESSSWDGRYALVVGGDIAVYAPGNARPTGGAGVVAMLVGPKAPIVLDRGVRSSHMEHAWDFYKPNLSSEYPLVDGKLSINLYLKALDSCYNIFRQKYQAKHGKKYSMDETDYSLFHSPFTKMVRKSHSRVLYNDFLTNDSSPKFATIDKKLKDLTAEESYNDKLVGKPFDELGKKEYSVKCEPALLLPKQLGNSYTASLYTSLIGLIANTTDKDLTGKRINMFSYGSGLAATMFSLDVVGSTDEIRKKSAVHDKLLARTKISPEDYTKVMKLREDTHSLANYKPVDSLNHVAHGAYVLSHVDDMKRRHYVLHH